MKFPSLLLFFLLCQTLSAFGQINTFPYTQSFENSFVTGKNVEFLPNWQGNEVSSGSSRIYRAGATDAYTGEAALGVLPTGTFTAELSLYFDATRLEAGEISFWARSGENGSGTRPAKLTVSFSGDGGETFTRPALVGGEGAFPNANTSYRLYQVELPEAVLGEPDAVVLLRVARDAGGEGTAARLFIDDFTLAAQAAVFRVLSAEAVDEKSIRLRFNRELDRASAERISNYRLDGGVVVTNAVLDDSDKRQVILRTSSLEPGKTYSLELGGVKDNRGESAEGQAVRFTYTDAYVLQVYDLLISEVHAAPNEHTLLPDVEWVELYNASGRALSLEGIRFSDEGRTGTLPSYTLAAGEYVVLAPAADAARLDPYGPVLRLSSWPSLNNDSDVLSLHSPEGRLLDRVAYQKSWYGSSDKAQGGWSLERIDLNNPCIGAANWSASVSSAGGSPATENSIADSKPDLSAPELLQALAVDSLSIQLLFNEPLDTAAFSLDWFRLQPEIKIEAVHILHQDRLELHLAAPLSASVNYLLYVRNLQDCSGNLLQPVEGRQLAFPKPAEAGDVVINELMFDPPPGSEEYVEIANVSDKYINLQNWQLSTYNNGIKSTAVISREILLLPPQSFLAFSRNPEAVQTAFPAAPPEHLLRLEGLPLLPNAGDSLALFNNEGELMDLFGYSVRLHSPFIQETKGVSLERIQLKAPTNGAENWTSAAGSSNYGTPGQVNSQALRLSSIQEVLEITPEVLLPGNSGVADVAAIRFQSDRGGLMASLRIFNEQGQEVRVLANNQLIGREAFFSWNGATEAGSPVRTGYYIVVLQLHDAGGYKRTYRKTIVVGNGFE